jgi:hypothetical protein
MNNKEQKVETSTETAIVGNTLLAAGFPSPEQPVAVNKVSVEYTQEADSNSDGLQLLEVSTEDAGAGVYYVLKTERWAFDNLNDLIKVLNDFEKRLSDCR